MHYRILALVFSAMIVFVSNANGQARSGKLSPVAGWVVHETDIPFAELYPRLKSAIKATELRQITTASASAGAKGRGLTISGNRVVGVYNNFFAVRMLEASIAAGIEAPLRFYLTERNDGGSSLSYKMPTTVFSPYFDEGGQALQELAGELDALFERIATETIR